LTELNLARDVRGNEKSFCGYDGEKRKARGSLGPLQKDKGRTWETWLAGI